MTPASVWPINAAGVALVKEFEGCRLTSYQCPAGRWTVGYGHTGFDVKPSQTITQAEADEFLRRDLIDAAAVVTRAVKAPLNENQRAALVSLCMNIGGGAFSTSSLVKRCNVEAWDEAAREFPRWVHAGGRKLEGLIRRREAERQLFLRAP